MLNLSLVLTDRHLLFQQPTLPIRTKCYPSENVGTVRCDRLYRVQLKFGL